MNTDTPSALAPTGHECHAATEQAMTEQAPQAPRRGRLGTIRDVVVAFVGAILAILPHVMHHIGLLVGTAFLTGAGGNALFYVIGLALSIPMLRRLYRRFGSWRAPGIAIAVFTAVFSLSAFVIGPAITGSGDDPGKSPSVPSEKAPSPDPHGH